MLEVVYIVSLCCATAMARQNYSITKKPVDISIPVSMYCQARPWPTHLIPGKSTSRTIN